MAVIFFVIQTSSSKSVCLPYSVCPPGLMGLFLHSFKFQMDSLYISWQLSRSRKQNKKKKRNKSGTKRVCSWRRKSGVLSGGGQNEKHFLFFLFLFSPTLFPLTPGLNRGLLKKPPIFSRPFPGVFFFNNASSVTVANLCIHRPSLQAQDLPITNSQRDRGAFNYNRKLRLIILPSKTY